MPLSHIVMHVALCQSAVREAANRDVPLHIVLTDRIERTALDQKFSIERGSTREAPIEFDIPFGIYRASVSTSTCGAVGYFSVIPDVNRGVSISLQQGRPQAPIPPAIVQGTAPFEFAYVQPVVEVFPKTVKCDDPIGDPLNVGIEMDNEPNSYYATIAPSADLERNAPVTLAVRMNDSHGGYQYLRVPIGDAIGYRTAWPSLGQLNITSGLIDQLAGKPEDTLLCIRMTKTTVGA
ncbi:MAG TPA: hypothetical protein VGZ02_02210 [Candidatus Baltobacteraceae bacterium]|jgi:hypothetical protein|nr:hypothetical protein [Candidatus Baltobacteraceae bacterium]